MCRSKDDIHDQCFFVDQSDLCLDFVVVSISGSRYDLFLGLENP